MSQRNPAISKGVDWIMIWLYFALVLIGLLSIFSVTYRDGDPILKSFISGRTDYSKQLLFFFISCIIGLFILLTDSKFFTATANIWYSVGILMLLLVFPFHTEVKGTESIIRFGGFQVQPAEICKIFVCLALAKYLSRVETDFSKTRSHLIAAAIVEDKTSNFYTLKIKPATNFFSVEYVSVAENLMKEEQKKLEEATRKNQ